MEGVVLALTRNQISSTTTTEKIPAMEQLKQHLSTLNQRIASVVERL